jgi:hypothetical protein
MSKLHKPVGTNEETLLLTTGMIIQYKILAEQLITRTHRMHPRSHQTPSVFMDSRELQMISLRWQKKLAPQGSFLEVMTGESVLCMMP